MALGIRESMTLFLIGLHTITICHEHDETDSYTNVSFLAHELWSIQENGDIRKCSCSRLDVAIHLIDCADPYLHVILSSCSVQSLRQNAK
jgi:hypothetical protein